MNTPYKVFTVTLETLDKYTTNKGIYEHTCAAKTEHEAVADTVEKFFKENPDMKFRLKQVIAPTHKDGETILQVKTSK